MDLISRQMVIDAVTKYCTHYDLRELLADIEVMPSAQKTGHWSHINAKDYKAKCSCCGVWSPIMGNYCPYCGSRNLIF